MVDDVAYFRADNKYTMVMTADGEALLRKPIRELLDVLDPAMFKQIHRSTIVNLKAIAADRARRHRQGHGAAAPATGNADGEPAVHGVVPEHVESFLAQASETVIRHGYGIHEFSVAPRQTQRALTRRRGASRCR